MDRSFGSRIGLVVLTAGAMVGAYYLHLYFLMENCYLDHEGGPVPALASNQGKVCGDPDSPLNFVLFAFESGAVIAVIGFVMAYRSAQGWLGKLLAFVVPVLVMGFVWGALSLPSDTCSKETKNSQPAGRCATSAG